MKNLKRVVVLLGVMAVAAVGCSRHDAGSDSLSALGLCTLGLEQIFKADVQPVMANNCASCHTSSGPGNGAFADANLGLSFKDFYLRGWNKVKNRALDTNHAPPYTGVQHQAALDAIEPNWLAQETQAIRCQEAIGRGPSETIDDDPILDTSTIFTGNQDMPQVAAPDAFQTVTWDLGSEIVTPDNLNFPGASIEMGIRTFTTSTDNKNYEITTPRLTAGGEALHLILLEVKINDNLMFDATTFKQVNRRVRAGDTRDLALTTMVIPYDFAAGDTISLGFGLLQAIDFDPPSFNELVGNGGIFDRNCAGCHDPGNQDGNIVITNSGNNAATLQALKNSVIFAGQPSASQLYLLVLGDVMPDPAGGGDPLPQTEKDLIRDWILDGAL